MGDKGLKFNNRWLETWAPLDVQQRHWQTLKDVSSLSEVRLGSRGDLIKSSSALHGDVNGRSQQWAATIASALYRLGRLNAYRQQTTRLDILSDNWSRDICLYKWFNPRSIRPMTDNRLYIHCNLGVYIL